MGLSLEGWHTNENSARRQLEGQRGDQGFPSPEDPGTEPFEASTPGDDGPPWMSAIRKKHC
jgi:hypothetical protein